MALADYITDNVKVNARVVNGKDLGIAIFFWQKKDVILITLYAIKEIDGNLHIIYDYFWTL